MFLTTDVIDEASLEVERQYTGAVTATNNSNCVPSRTTTLEEIPQINQSASSKHARHST